LRVGQGTSDVCKGSGRGGLYRETNVAGLLVCWETGRTDNPTFICDWSFKVWTDGIHRYLMVS
jgi:hypothetical protein